MATQEERLVTLEQFRTETLLAYKDMAFEVTMVKGLTNDAIGRLAVLQRDVSEIKDDVRTLRAELAERNARLDLRLDGLFGQLALILDRLPPA